MLIGTSRTGATFSQCTIFYHASDQSIHFNARYNNYPDLVAPAPPLNQWILITGRITGNVQSLWYDGVKVAEQAVASYSYAADGTTRTGALGDMPGLQTGNNWSGPIAMGLMATRGYADAEIAALAADPFVWDRIPSSGGSMTIVQQAGLQNLAGGTTITVSFPGAVTAGNLIVVGFVQWSATGDVITVSDSKGNSYAAAGTRASLTGTGIAAIYWGIATTGGSSFSVTVSVTSAGAYLTMMIGEFSFGAGSTISVEGYSTGTGAGSPFDSGLITPVTAGDLIIGVVNSGSVGSPTAGSGFTLPAEWVYTSGAGEPGLMEYLLSASGPLNAIATAGSAGTWAMEGAAFKATAPVGAPAGGGASLLMGL